MRNDKHIRLVVAFPAFFLLLSLLAACASSGGGTSGSSIAQSQSANAAATKPTSTAQPAVVTTYPNPYKNNKLVQETLKGGSNTGLAWEKLASHCQFTPDGYQVIATSMSAKECYATQSSMVLAHPTFTYQVDMVFSLAEPGGGNGAGILFGGAKNLSAYYGFEIFGDGSCLLYLRPGNGSLTSLNQNCHIPSFQGDKTMTIAVVSQDNTYTIYVNGIATTSGKVDPNVGVPGAQIGMVAESANRSAMSALFSNVKLWYK